MLNAALGIAVEILRQFLLAQIATESPYNAQTMYTNPQVPPLEGFREVAFQVPPLEGCREVVLNKKDDPCESSFL